MSEKEFMEFLVRMLEVVDQRISTEHYEEARLIVLGMLWTVDARLHNGVEV